MGMDFASFQEKQLRREEIKYMQDHPSLYPYMRKHC